MIIAANWKQYVSPKEENALLLEFGTTLKIHTGQEIWIFPSMYSLMCLTKMAKALAIPVTVGAQDIAPALDGALTGGVRADFIRNELVLVGHSERRKVFHEKINDIKQKLQVALDCNKKIILCIGEEKKTDDEEIIKILKEELAEYEDIMKGRTSQVIIAYEPWWAVGGTNTPTVHALQKVSTFLHIRGFTQVLYGGSVDSNTIAKIMCPEVAGFLIGRASTSVAMLQSIVDQLRQE